MNNWSLEYILSQILIIISYILICKTYFLNKRNKILIINVFGHAFQGLSFLLLNGLTGAAMSFVYVIRDSFFVLDEKNRNNTILNKRDYIILIIIIFVIVLLTFFTYNGLGSLLSVIATTISTVAIWQKKPKYYKMIGIPISVFWIGYYIFLKSIFAIVLEFVLLISTITGFLCDKNNKNEKIDC